MPTIDHAAVLRLQAQAALRAGDFSKAQELRARAQEVDR